MTEPVKIGDATLYLGDCLEILPTLGKVDVLITDPPYGINYVVNARSWQNEGLKSLKPWEMDQQPAINGDDQPFCADHLLAYSKSAVFGGNHIAGLPTGGRWIIWDKRRDSTPDDHSDCEVIWTNVPGADRIHRQKWRGIVREGEENCARSRKLHPNQKPVALLAFIAAQIGGEAPGLTVLDPYMGSGSVGVVCARSGQNYIGIEIEHRYFDIACKRIEQAYAEPDLFVEPPRPAKQEAML